MQSRNLYIFFFGLIWCSVLFAQSTLSPQAAIARTDTPTAQTKPQPQTLSKPVTKVPAAAPAQPLDNLINAWLKRNEIQHSFVGVEVMELPSGRLMYSSNGNRRFAPASTTKVLTTACAYTLLGAGYTFRTQLFAGGKITGDTLSGDAVLVPSEDPSLKAEDLRQLLSSSLQQRKIHKIEGTLVLAPPHGGTDYFSPNWLIEDFGQDWMPVSSDLVVDRNISQGVVNFKGIRSVNVGAGDNFNALERSLLNSEEAAGWLTYNPYSREMLGYIGAGVSTKSPLSITDPNEFNTALAIDMMDSMGVHTGKLQNSAAGELLGEHMSKPLPILIEHCLHKSDNLFAQQLLRTLALPAPNAKGSAANAPLLEDSGLSRLSHWLSSIGVPQQEAVLLDGCGLSRKNGISPHALNMVLKYMAGPKVDGPFLGLLKSSGTVTKKGQFLFKTGSMDTVRSIAGVLGTAGGQQLAVAIIINDHIQNVKGLGGTLTDLVSLLNEITNIAYIPVKTPDGKDTGETKPMVEMTHPAVTYGNYSRQQRSHRRRHH
jgi:serine-type D-Ala-D-Ala carboxypeptidase/endopeptidase (penicillin-binding protein 4)